jgi:RNA polymerase sigma-70 factor (ECF subfamily)
LSYSAHPEQQTIGRDCPTLVNRLIAKLPEKQRTCMQLRDIEGKSYRDIAKILDMTEQQVKINIFRGRQTVKQNFFQIDL